ncbi:MAG: hypothetical protein K6U03_00935 [Firmicutes bacterium]|nr:hypothetical protein [Bacillota bacterium]
MLQEIAIEPSVAGVVYTHRGNKWAFFPEDRLLVGMTGSVEEPTFVRSVLSFSLPEFDNDAHLLRAYLRLQVVRNEPSALAKPVCLRETPHGAAVPWTMEEERQQPVLAAHRLSCEINLPLDFDLTPLVEAWWRKAPNNGILLDFGENLLGIVGFGNGRQAEPFPVLKIVRAFPAPGRVPLSMTLEPQTRRVSRILPVRPTAVKNHGPGLAWVTPLYLHGGRLVDPAGLPWTVLAAGEYAVYEPKLPLEGLAFGVETALEKATVVLIPLAGE